MKNIFRIILLLSLCACTKKLGLKPDTAIILPESALDMERILDNTDVMNLTGALPHVSSDEYFIPSLQEWQSFSTATVRNASVWNDKYYEGESRIPDWTYPYNTIFYANSVLDVLSRQDIAEDGQKKVLQGWALFARSYAFYCLVSTFATPYQEATAAKDLGIPLRLHAGIDEIVQRATVKETYNQIIKDLVSSAELLNRDIIPNKRNRPSKIAAYALLARVYLSMRNYALAEEYADKSRSLYSVLTDFNTLNKTAATAFTYNSEEIIYFTRQVSDYFEVSSGLRTTYGVRPELIALYSVNDLRLPIYFRINSQGNHNSKPINSRTASPFTGLATDETLLIKAECLARRDESAMALQLLDQLAAKRWNPAGSNPAKPYIQLSVPQGQSVLDVVLRERQKALIWRGLRWTDLRRLNLEGRNIIVQRKLNDQLFTLMPNSSKYVLPIPEDEIAMSGLQQNDR